MSATAYAAISFLVVAAITFFTATTLFRLVPAIRRDRLAPAAPEAVLQTILRFEDRPRTAWERMVERIGRTVQPKQAARITHYRQRLAWAGYHDPRALTLLWGAKLACALTGALLYPFLGLLTQRVLPNTVMYVPLLFAIGFFMPDFWLYNRRKERQRNIVNTLPDVLDMLMVCVEAGLGFDAAVARVAEQPDLTRSPLHQEMMRMHLEVRAGRPREEAMRAFGERTGAQEVKSMVGAFVQAERMGTPLGKTLRVHAESARLQRRYRAEQKAYLAPLKMIFPTVLFLMPAFMMVAMAPSILGLIKAFQTLAR
jgi:tight adherence protein C